MLATAAQKEEYLKSQPTQCYSTSFCFTYLLIYLFIVYLLVGSKKSWCLPPVQRVWPGYGDLLLPKYLWFSPHLCSLPAPWQTVHIRSWEGAKTRPAWESPRTRKHCCKGSVVKEKWWTFTFLFFILKLLLHMTEIWQALNTISFE